MSGRRRMGKVWIALAGGGPLGGIYEIGALLALEEALKGVRLTECDVYVGVSSGAFVAAGLANGISSREMTRCSFSTGPIATRSSRICCCGRPSASSRGG